jgi:hypothetical protein
LGGLAASISEMPVGNRRKNSRPVGPPFSPCGRCFGHERNEGRGTGIAERRERSEARRAARSRSALIIPGRRGNRPEGPCGGKGGVGSGSRRWETRRMP